MSMRDMIITPVWQQITDGTQDVKIHVLRGVMYLSEVPPHQDKTETYYVVTDMIIVTLPHQIWCRSPWRCTCILVTMKDHKFGIC
ncbi:hypothetical protein PUATCC27989T_00702 [Phytobacter ursingii]|nr:hypothetical protein PUATCC27989T_00702 [Phytobacter ursingii]